MLPRLSLNDFSGLLAGLLILALGLWIYWPGVASAPILDDMGNLGKLDRLSENPEYAWDYVFGNRSGLLGRPVAMATFVFERLYLGSVPDITLKLNVILHLCNGLLVTALLHLLFRQVGFRRSGTLAVVLGGLWLLAPMHVSTVLYQVQRMAMLCTSFMMLSCVTYLLWRRSQEHHDRGGAGWLFCCIASAVLALFTKENGIVVVPVLLLMEVLWVSGAASSPFETRMGRFSLWTIVLGLAAVAVGLALNWAELQNKFVHREFSLEERLLTQTRVLWDYAGQFLWPDLAKLGVYHDDVPVSRSLWEPISTVWASAGWGALVCLGLYLSRFRWGRLLLLGPAFYLVAHGLEGSVFPLELYFEHRNYFPSIGLIILLGTVLGLLARSWPELASPLLAWLGFAVLLFAMMTSSQVQVWSSPQLRVMHHVNGHPGSFRANADMAVLLAEAGDIEAARPYAQTASDVGRNLSGGDHAVFALLLDCLAGVSLDQARIDHVGSGQKGSRLGSSNILLALVRALQNETCPDAGAERFSDRMAEVFIAEGTGGSGRLFYALAVMENSLERYDRANEYADRFLARTDRKSTALLMKLHFLTALGDRGGIESTVAELQRMEKDGKLTQQERDNLGYYTEAPEAN